MDLGTALSAAGFREVVWIPDSTLGRFEPALHAEPGLRLLRVAREGEAWALALGLWAAGGRPFVVMQCTGLFESGDSLRNAVLDYRAPLCGMIGVRNAARPEIDSAPGRVEPFLRAFGVPYRWLGGAGDFSDLAAMFRPAGARMGPYLALLPEGGGSAWA